MKFNSILILICSLISAVVFAQPANNACSGAPTLPQNGGCLTGTTVAATDLWVGTVGCAGNNAEVWYTFVATGTQANIVVTSGTLGGNIELTLASATGLCTGLSIAGSNCGPSVLNSTFNGIQVGVRYYVTISSTGANGTFTICNTVTTPPPVPGQDCTTPAVLCNNNSFTQGAFTGVGAVETISTNTCFFSQERQSRWYTFTIGCTGTFGFYVNPTTATNDIDWVIINTTTGGCSSSGLTLKPQVACNWSGCYCSTGISANPSAIPNARNANGNGPGSCGGVYAAFTTSLINMTAGNTYTMLIDNFSTSGNGYSVFFGEGTAVMGPSAAFTTSLNATCLTLSVAKTCPTSNSTYLWNYGDGTTSTLQNPPAKTYVTPGNYNVSLTVTDALGCVRTTSQTVNVGCLPLPVELSTLNGERSERFMDLTWEMASEQSNDYFTLERSLDGISWEYVTQIKSIGDHTDGYSYTYRDDIQAISLTKTVYYRLFQTDMDGTMKNLGTVVASGVKAYDSAINISVQPNPSDEEVVQLVFENLYDETGVISIADLNGHILEANDVQLSKGYTSLNLNTNSWKKGVYIISFSTKNSQERTRFIKL